MREKVGIPDCLGEHTGQRERIKCTTVTPKWNKSVFRWTRGNSTEYFFSHPTPHQPSRAVKGAKSRTISPHESSATSVSSAARERGKRGWRWGVWGGISLADFRVVMDVEGAYMQSLSSPRHTGVPRGDPLQMGSFTSPPTFASEKVTRAGWGRGSSVSPTCFQPQALRRCSNGQRTEDRNNSLPQPSLPNSRNFKLCSKRTCWGRISLNNCKHCILQLCVSSRHRYCLGFFQYRC